MLDELTDLPDDPALIGEFRQANASIPREGTQNLLAAARAGSAGQFLAQSVAWPLEGDAGAATAELERSVLEAGGVVLRYGRLYGPGIYYEEARPRDRASTSTRRRNARSRHSRRTPACSRSRNTCPISRRV